MKKIDFAILAPVPEEHLVSSQPKGALKTYVSFGSQKWELFREIDMLRLGQNVPGGLGAADPDFVISRSPVRVRASAREISYLRPSLTRQEFRVSDG